MSYIKIVLAIYMASYFMFNTAFVHNHNINGQNITHSHPFKGLQHSENVATIIKIVNDSQILGETIIAVVTAVPVFVETIETGYFTTYISPNQYYTSLRAPPAV